MNLSERPHYPGPDDRLDEALAAIVEEAFPAEDPNFQRPADEDVEAYVLGGASNEQREIVAEAMCQSQAFAAEVLARIEAEDHLADPEFRQRLESIQTPVQELRNELRSGRSFGGDGSRIPDPSGIRRLPPTTVSRRRPSVRWRAWLWRPAVGYSLALMLLSVIPLSRLLSDRSGAESLVQEFTLKGLRVESSRGERGERVSTAGYERISFGTAVPVVDLVVSAHPPFKLRAQVAFGALLRSAAGDTVLSAMGIRRLMPISTEEGNPALRLDAALLTPGFYSLEFLPYRANGSPIETGRVIGYFEVVAP